jgi:ABC-type uncharacterized transport system substrate-binding protein
LIGNGFPILSELDSFTTRLKPKASTPWSEIREKSEELGLEVFALPVTNSAETQLVAQSLVDRILMFSLPCPTTSFSRPLKW